MWANVMVSFAVLGLLVILARAGLTFRPHRARNVKYAEASHRFTIDTVGVAAEHPEIIKIARFDRHPWFVGVHLCVLGYTTCVFLGAKLTSNVSVLGDSARYTMATCFFVGSLLVLTGATLGTRIGRWTMGGKVSDHPTHAVLGDDITLPYRLSMAGMGAMTVSSGIYAWTSFQSTTGSLGGWLTGGIAALCAITIIWFYRAVDQFTRWDQLLTERYRVRAGIDDAC